MLRAGKRLAGQGERAIIESGYTSRARHPSRVLVPVLLIGFVNWLELSGCRVAGRYRQRRGVHEN